MKLDDTEMNSPGVWLYVVLIAASLASGSLVAGCEPSAETEPTLPKARAVANSEGLRQTREATTGGARRPQQAQVAHLLARRAWHMIGDVEHRCETVDYFPGGGMYTFYCRLKNFATFERFRQYVDMPIFLGGPHRDTGFERSARTDFGRYNPEFVRRLADWTLPAAADPAFREATQAIYERNIRPLARIFWVTHRKLEAHPTYWREQQRALQRHMADDGVPSRFYDKYYYFMNPGFMARPDGGYEHFADRGLDGGVYNGNVVNSAVGFWIRRGIDGTADEFATGLEKLLRTYDGDFVDETLSK